MLPLALILGFYAIAFVIRPTFRWIRATYQERMENSRGIYGSLAKAESKSAEEGDEVDESRLAEEDQEDMDGEVDTSAPIKEDDEVDESKPAEDDDEKATPHESRS
jgi:hypothetical protein